MKDIGEKIKEKYQEGKKILTRRSDFGDNKMLVSKTDTIPNKHIINVIGNVTVKKLELWNQDEGKVMEKLMEKAILMGANAIINFSYRGSGLFGTHGMANGMAVKVEDINIDKLKNESLELLKMRLVKGEISKKEFLELSELL
jgi:uncharacterized protein YbjQ (UPF0145 family)